MPKTNIKKATYPPWQTKGTRTTRPELTATMKRIFELPPLTKEDIVKEYEKIQPK